MLPNRISRVNEQSSLFLSSFFLDYTFIPRSTGEIFVSPAHNYFSSRKRVKTQEWSEMHSGHTFLSFSLKFKNIFFFHIIFNPIQGSVFWNEIDQEKPSVLCVVETSVLIAHWPFFLSHPSKSSLSRCASIATLKSFVHYCIRENKMESNTKKSKSIMLHFKWTTSIYMNNFTNSSCKVKNMALLLELWSKVSEDTYQWLQKSTCCLACKNCKLIFSTATLVVSRSPAFKTQQWLHSGKLWSKS